MALSTLLVDDNKTFLSAVRSVLQHVVGVEVVASASTSGEALEFTLRLRPDLVLLDLALPGLGGLALATQLSALPDAPSVIMLSMHDSPAYRLAAASAGASAFVRKDNFVSELVPLLEQLISVRQTAPTTKGNPWLRPF